VSRTNSPITIGRNATFFSLRYDTSIDNLFDTKLISRYCFARFQSALSIDLLARDNALRKIILVTDGIFGLSNANHLSINNVNYIIESLAVNLKEVYYIFMYGALYVSVCACMCLVHRVLHDDADRHRTCRIIVH